MLGPDLSQRTNPTKTILFLGGSTTETNEVAERFRFPYLSARLLSERSSQVFQGLNLGVRGNTSRDSTILLLTHPAVRAADYVVLMHNINDRLLLAVKGGYNAPLGNAGTGSWSQVAGSAGGFLSSLWDYASYRSNLLFLLRNTVFGMNPWTGERAQGVVSETSIDFPDFNLPEHRKLFSQSLRVFVQVVRALGKTPVLLTQPLGHDSAQHAAFNETIRRVATEEDVALIDLADHFSKGEPWVFLADGIHFSDEGSKAVSKIIARSFTSTASRQEYASPKASGAYPMRFDQCLPPPGISHPVKPGPARPLLRMRGRYPVFSYDERRIFLQSREDHSTVIYVYNRDQNTYRRLAGGNNQGDARHGVPTTKLAHGEDGVLFGLTRDSWERLFYISVKDGEPSAIPLPDEMSASIPAADSDGRILFAGSTRAESPPDLYRFHPETEELTRLTETQWEEWRPAPTPDGRYVYHIANPDRQFDLYRVDTQSREITRVYGTDADEWDPDVSPDGKWLAFASKVGGDWDLYLLSRRSDQPPIQLTDRAGDEWDPRFLPQSHAIAFAASHDRPPRMYYLCPFGEKAE